MKLDSKWSKYTVFSENQLLYFSFSERPFLKILLLLCLPLRSAFCSSSGKWITS